MYKIPTELIVQHHDLPSSFLIFQAQKSIYEQIEIKFSMHKGHAIKSSLVDTRLTFFLWQLFKSFK